MKRSELAHALREGNQLAQRAILLDLGVTVAVRDEQVEIRTDGNSDLAPAATISVPAKRVDRGSDPRMPSLATAGRCRPIPTRSCSS